LKKDGKGENQFKEAKKAKKAVPFWKGVHSARILPSRKERSELENFRHRKTSSRTCPNEKINTMVRRKKTGNSDRTHKGGSAIIEKKGKQSAADFWLNRITARRGGGG